MKNAIVDEGAALLPSDDDGLVELPSDDCDDGGAWSSHQAKAAPTPAKAARHPHRAKAPPTHAQMTEWSQNPNARKRQRRPEQMRKWLGEPRGDQPRDVIPGPSAGGPRGDHPRDVIPGPSAGPKSENPPTPEGSPLLTGSSSSGDSSNDSPIPQLITALN